MNNLEKLQKEFEWIYDYVITMWYLRYINKIKRFNISNDYKHWYKINFIKICFMFKCYFIKKKNKWI